MILGWLSAQLADEGRAVARLDRMKFLRVLRPSVRLEASLKSRGLTVSAEFRDPDGPIATASLVLR